jgi:hypothetical protein
MMALLLVEDVLKIVLHGFPVRLAKKRHWFKSVPATSGGRLSGATGAATLHE